MERWQLTQFQNLPLDVKIAKSRLRIQEWYEHYGGQVNVSFSGGKDSSVLLHLVRSLYPKVPAVFSDTGLEFPEIRAFVKTIPNRGVAPPGAHVPAGGGEARVSGDQQGAERVDS